MEVKIMNFMEYVCRGIVRSEDAIDRLNKKVTKMAKTNASLNINIAGICVAGLILTAIVAVQDREIKALQKQVNDLAKDMEEKNQQEGA
jgi:poly(3-hydroxyalkanoate) synthetase